MSSFDYNFTLTGLGVSAFFMGLFGLTALATSIIWGVLLLVACVCTIRAWLLISRAESYFLAEELEDDDDDWNEDQIR